MANDEFLTGTIEGEMKVTAATKTDAERRATPWTVVPAADKAWWRNISFDANELAELDGLRGQQARMQALMRDMQAQRRAMEAAVADGRSHDEALAYDRALDAGLSHFAASRHSDAIVCFRRCAHFDPHCCFCPQVSMVQKATRAASRTAWAASTCAPSTSAG